MKKQKLGQRDSGKRRSGCADGRPGLYPSFCFSLTFLAASSLLFSALSSCGRSRGQVNTERREGGRRVSERAVEWGRAARGAGSELECSLSHLVHGRLQVLVIALAPHRGPVISLHCRRQTDRARQQRRRRERLSLQVRCPSSPHPPPFLLLSPLMHHALPACS